MRKRKRSPSACPYCDIEGLEPVVGTPIVGPKCLICPACRGPLPKETLRCVSMTKP